MQPPAKAAPWKIVKASAVSTAELPEGLKKVVTSESKAAASPRASADQPKEAKTSTRKKGQESPETKVSTPMQTRRQAARQQSSQRVNQDDGSRAGGFRPGVGGSGQTDTCVASSHPS
jgi:hypothetical protein